ncbi:T-cell-interacting, activating receptor on myeloid cells protein 1-like isoform X2 [Dermochelys coriacea]|uniref:T-cell-interacting, activating receptor on myeloid cells protein 1-like isoform X2 n=1 Tax=Dermochelys coriacea TaxID=27794 RepID=UPI001CA8C548|nr:T-cell-interacting, activating receptor on myeloid cells protein 1-like isoform X2 [Dermochelys coriacea]
MASAFTVLFLGYWLVGRSGVLGERSLPKPSISISPGGVIPMGGNVTIQCWHQHLGMRFLLYKDGDRNHLTLIPTSYKWKTTISPRWSPVPGDMIT